MVGFFGRWHPVGVAWSEPRRYSDWVERLWALSGAAAIVLFACGLLFGDLLATTNYPPVNASSAALADYLLANRGDVRALSFFHLLAALAFVCFASCLRVRLSHDGVGMRQAGTAALAGGVAAGVFLALSAVCYRVLSEPIVARDPALAHAFLVASYLTGGPAFALQLTLPIAAGVAAARSGLLLPRWSGWLGIAAVVCGLGSAGIMLGPTNNSSAWYGILLLGAVLGFAWLIYASVWLAFGDSHRRPA